MSITEYREIGSQLRHLLELENSPVAISFMDTPPPGIRKNIETVPSGCVFWIKGFKDTFYTDREDHANCNIGCFTHGFLAPDDLSLEKAPDVKLFQDTGYFPMNEFSKVPRMEKPPNYVAYGPLEETRFEPDVVLIVCTPQQAMLIAEAAKSPKLMGAPTCGAIPIAYKEGQVGVSLGCVTNRIRTGLKTSELVVTIPKKELRTFAENLKLRVDANNKVAQAVTAMLNVNK
jgi:uncharacterized protein (DUF169 family)